MTHVNAGFEIAGNVLEILRHPKQAFPLCQAGASAVPSGAHARPVRGSSSPDAYSINGESLSINPVTV
jgi:hypothetical protein